MTPQQPWLLGLDLTPRSGGALQFARWLRGKLRAPILGVHISELWITGLVPDEGSAYLFALRSEAERWLDTLDAGAAGSAVDEVKIFDDVDAEGGLAAAAAGAPAIIVGRRVAGEGTWVRLGRVTRRLLRSSPAPVVVVPPELATGTFSGPVLLASEIGEDSVAAARFAVSLARQLGRPLVCIHVGQPRWEEARAAEVPIWEELRRKYRAAVQRQAREWAQVHCPDAELVVDYGDPQEQLTAAAARLGACLLVVGSHCPGLVERFFVGSTSSALAATAGCAVAVVPAHPRREGE